MSATPRETYRCAWCDGDRTPQASVKGSYCSQACYDAHRRERQARDLLNTLQYDHRFCFTCFRQLKTVERPSDPWVLANGSPPDAFVGYQDGTEHTSSGWRTIQARDTVEIVREGLACRCGVCDHRDADPLLRERHRLEYGEHLVDAIATLRSEGKVDVGLSEDALFRALAHSVPVDAALYYAIEL